MTTHFSKFACLLSPAALALASCSAAQDVDTANAAEIGEDGFSIEDFGTFSEGWAIEFAPGTQMLLVSEKSGTLKILDTASGTIAEVSGAPEVAYGGQGGLGDIAFLPSEADAKIDGRTIYLSWAEAGNLPRSRGAAVGRGKLSCDAAMSCAVEGLEVIWRQWPKVDARGHFSHRIVFAPDEKHMFVASGDRQKLSPAQDRTSALGSIVRLNLDGTPASDNPWADKKKPESEIWSWGHRNILGMDWDAEGRLWEIEHGPAGGDELNIVEKAANYGWPERSYGNHYSGDEIPDHTADDGFVKPKAHWTPVIAPGDMLIYRGDMFAGWKGNALVAGLASSSLVHIDLDGESAIEAGRYELAGNRLRALAEGPDGALWVMEDGKDGQLLKLSM